jgi:hypothetical protein
MTGCSIEDAQREIDMSIERPFVHAGWLTSMGEQCKSLIKGLVKSQTLHAIGITCPDEFPLFFVSPPRPSD